MGIAFNRHFAGDGAMIFKHACALGCEGIVSKRLGSPYRAGRVDHWLKIKNPAAPPITGASSSGYGSRRRSAGIRALVGARAELARAAENGGSSAPSAQADAVNQALLKKWRRWSSE